MGEREYEAAEREMDVLHNELHHARVDLKAVQSVLEITAIENVQLSEALTRIANEFTEEQLEALQPVIAKVALINATEIARDALTSLYYQAQIREEN